MEIERQGRENKKISLGVLSGPVRDFRNASKLQQIFERGSYDWLCTYTNSYNHCYRDLGQVTTESFLVFYPWVYLFWQERHIQIRIKPLCRGDSLGEVQEREVPIAEKRHRSVQKGQNRNLLIFQNTQYDLKRTA